MLTAVQQSLDRRICATCEQQLHNSKVAHFHGVDQNGPLNSRMAVSNGVLIVCVSARLQEFLNLQLVFFRDGRTQPRVLLSRSDLRGIHASRQRLNLTQSDRKSTRLNSSHSQISYAVFC